MARIFTTPAAEMAAKAWFHDVVLAAGLSTNNLKQYPPNLVKYNYSADCDAICQEIANRDFTNIDKSINSVSGLNFEADFEHKRNFKNLKPEGIAKAIVYVAEVMGLYWDDSVRTPYEIDEFKKTLLGQAVFKYGRYISAVSAKMAKKSTRSGSTSTKAPGQPPKNGYKQSGPQSSKVRDLLDLTGNKVPAGNAGQKIYADTSYIYKIIGENPQSKNRPTVFIKPLSASGATGTTNKIFISSGNGYTDCTCYFDDPNDATNFLNKIISNNRVPSNVSNLQVVKNKADSNGYFLVGTEFGPCAISAKTLNEALEESISEAAQNGWEKATKNQTKQELDELHAYMRKD